MLKDAVAAFAGTENPYETYMKAPPGIRLPKGKTLQLVNALNGTKQSANCFYTRICGILKGLDLTPTILDPCLFYRWNGQNLILAGIYVDDIRLVCDSQEDIEYYSRQLDAALPMSTPDVNLWLGMKVIHDRVEGTIRISQPRSIEELLKDFGLESANPVSTPAEPGKKLLKSRLPPGSIDFPYRELIGRLLWIARFSRPDILYAVTQLCSHVTAFDESHVTAAKRVLRYLKGTKDLELILRKQDEFALEVYADADFAGEPEGNDGAMRSLTGIVAYIRGVGPIFSQSKLQSTVSTSTAEAELKAVGSAVQFTLSIRQLLGELGFTPTLPTTIYNDNEACIASLKSTVSGSRLRHVKINFHFVKEKVAEKEVALQYLSTEKMLADIFTKALAKPRFLQLRSALMNNWNGGAKATDATGRRGGVSGYNSQHVGSSAGRN